MSKKSLTSGLLGTVTGLNKEDALVSHGTPVASVDAPSGKNSPVPEATEKRKPGRPNVDLGEPETCVTFKLPDSLVQEIKMMAVVGRTTQKEIVIAALKEYVAKKKIS